MEQLIDHALKSLVKSNECILCKTIFPTSQLATEHLNSEVHQINLKILRDSVREDISGREQISESKQDSNMDVVDLHCKKCNIKFISDVNAYEHYNSDYHKNSQDWFCELCPYQATSKTGIWDHLKTPLHEEKLLKTNVKSSNTPFHSNLPKEVKDLMGVDACQICNKTFHTVRQAKEHYFSIRHNQAVAHWFNDKRRKEKQNQPSPSTISKPIQVVPDIKPNISIFECFICHIKTPNKESMVAHIQGFPHHGLFKSKSALVKKGIAQEFWTFERQGKRIPCNLCGAFLESASSMMAHFRSNLHQSKYKEWCNLAVKKDLSGIATFKWFYCVICNKDLDGTSLAGLHYSEKEHEKKAAQNAKSKTGSEQNAANKNNSLKTQPLSNLQEIRPQSFECYLCNMKLNSKFERDLHLEAFPHIELARMKSSLIKQGVMEVFWRLEHSKTRITCTLCEAYLDCTSAVDSHCTGKKHRSQYDVWFKKLSGAKKNIPETDSKWFYCKVCDRDLDGTSGASLHYSAPSHLKHLEGTLKLDIDFPQLSSKNLVKFKRNIPENVTSREANEKQNSADSTWNNSSLVEAKQEEAETIKKEDQKIDALYRDVHYLLENLSVENINLTADRFSLCDIDTKEKLQVVVELVFEKAVRDMNSTRLCAMLCKKMERFWIQHENKTISFKILMLTRCQVSFERAGIDVEDKSSTADSELAKRDYVGSVRFIGELALQKFLTKSIIRRCMRDLLDISGEKELEALCVLVTVVGKEFEENDLGPREIFGVNDALAKLEDVANGATDILYSAAIRQMAQNVIDLKNNFWLIERYLMQKLSRDSYLLTLLEQNPLNEWNCFLCQRLFYSKESLLSHTEMFPHNEFYKLKIKLLKKGICGEFWRINGDDQCIVSCKLCNQSLFSVGEKKSHFTSMHHLTQYNNWLALVITEVLPECTMWPFFCQLCNVSLLGTTESANHYKSKTHLEKKSEVSDKPNIETGKSLLEKNSINFPQNGFCCSQESIMQTKELPKTKEESPEPETYTCFLCNIKVTSKSAKNVHVETFPHSEMAKIKTELVKQGIIQEFWQYDGVSLKCNICNFILPNATYTADHLSLVVHRERYNEWLNDLPTKKMISESDTKWYYCRVCDKDLDGTSESERHYLFASHQKRLELYCEICNVGYTTKDLLELHKTSTLHLEELKKTYDKKVETEDTQPTLPAPQPCESQTNKIETNIDINKPKKEAKTTKEQIINELEKLIQKLYYSKTVPHATALSFLKQINREADDLVNKYNGNKAEECSKQSIEKEAAASYQAESSIKIDDLVVEDGESMKKVKDANIIVVDSVEVNKSPGNLVKKKRTRKKKQEDNSSGEAIGQEGTGINTGDGQISDDFAVLTEKSLENCKEIKNFEDSAKHGDEKSRDLFDLLNEISKRKLEVEREDSEQQKLELEVLNELEIFTKQIRDGPVPEDETLKFLQNWNRKIDEDMVEKESISKNKEIDEAKNIDEFVNSEAARKSEIDEVYASFDETERLACEDKKVVTEALPDQSEVNKVEEYVESYSGGEVDPKSFKQIYTHENLHHLRTESTFRYVSPQLRDRLDTINIWHPYCDGTILRSADGCRSSIYNYYGEELFEPFMEFWEVYLQGSLN